LPAYTSLWKCCKFIKLPHELKSKRDAEVLGLGHCPTLLATGSWQLADYSARLWRVAFIICRIFSDDLCICFVTDLCRTLIQLDISTCCHTLISSSAYDFQSKHNQKVACNFNLLIVLPCLGICVYFQFELLNPKANSLNLFCGKEQ